MNGRRLTALAGAGAVAALLALGPATSSQAVPRPAFTKTETITRDHLVGGKDDVVDKRTFTVTADVTTNLRERQEITVRWTGAHPSGGIFSDPNSQFAADEEYPVVLMECRGLDSASVPASQRLSPQTCWTQTPTERFGQDAQFNFPPFRIDRYATPADRKLVVGAPSSIPAACGTSAVGAQHWVPFRAADGTTYYGGPLNGCAGIAPEAASTASSLQPSNTTYAASDLKGIGTSKFVVSTSDTNASLGCSAAVHCSLVVIPIEGISCDATAASLPADDQPASQGAEQPAAEKCMKSGRYNAGDQSTGFAKQEDLAVSGDLWWSASNWRNRISIPLTFAQAGNVCNLVNASTPNYIYGSELMVQASQQWAPAFCLDPKLFKFQHVQASEPESKRLLDSGAIEAAFEGAPPETPFGKQRAIVQAPTALTGFAIAYVVDDSTGHQYHSLRLTPRLLAKLLTESYPATADVRNEDTALSKNPLDIAEDPEFQALNPGVLPAGLRSEPAATLFSLSSQSDVLWALTSYITADPDARAFLDGKADPWGMKVNPQYKGIALPVNAWPLLDNWPCPCSDGNALPGLYSASRNQCLADSPSPWLNLVAAPSSSLATITVSMQFGIANSQLLCTSAGTGGDEKLVAVGREQPGQRFLLGIVPLADAQRYALDTAALLTHTDANAVSAFTDSTGRHFATPTSASLLAAADQLRPSESAGTWTMPYSTMRTSAAGEAAYPGTMLISTDVPTNGLPARDAHHYAEFLRFAATAGQTPGVGNGKLPAGFVPITRANGLGPLAAYTLAAAAAVDAQAGAVPSTRGGSLPATTPGAPAPGGHTGGTAGGSPSPPASTGPVPTVPPTGTRPPVVATAPPFLTVAASGRTPDVGAGFAGLLAPLVCLVAVVGGLAAA
ncbi:MAG: hypothetical protein JO079_14420, partial [Frankiaceae bacterium]|nr:hypothetical protein [Frankiaceae bacterium]